MYFYEVIVLTFLFIAAGHAGGLKEAISKLKPGVQLQGKNGPLSVQVTGL
jgi:hypothetical protein